jgi:membrane protease YdiL (CAAX protease family)
VPMEELLRDRLSIALVGLFATTLGPVCEELAFRGFLQPLLTRTFGAVVGVVLAALPFTLLHGPQYGWSWQHVLPVGLAGLSFGIVRYVTGSTAAATAMHATYNLTVFSAAVLQRGSSFRPW